MKTTQILTNESKVRDCKMTVFTVVFLNRDIPAIEYKARIETTLQYNEYINAIRNENSHIDYIRTEGLRYTEIMEKNH